MGTALAFLAPMLSVGARIFMVNRLVDKIEHLFYYYCAAMAFVVAPWHNFFRTLTPENFEEEVVPHCFDNGFNSLPPRPPISVF